LSDAQRQTLWEVFAAVAAGAIADGLASMAGMFTRPADGFADAGASGEVSAAGRQLPL
jgi:hypothetical protein